MKKKKNKIPCKPGMCLFCEKQHECALWHDVVEHNMPLLFGADGKTALAELKWHLGHLWYALKGAIAGEGFTFGRGTEARDLRALALTEVV